jgi:phosphoribosylaminoimidazole-succinocarboxamide synthase
MALQKIAEGKTKTIWQDPDDDQRVLIEGKPDITAGDGAKRDVIEGKDVLATTTTINCFELLRRAGVRSHYVETVDGRTFRALKLQMLPIEVVVRRIATGSYLKRDKEIPEGTVFDELKVEFFFKDDARHDPLMLWNEDGHFELHHPKKPVGLEQYEDLAPADILEDGTRELLEDRYMPYQQATAIQVFETLEAAWAQLGVTLVDFKIEFGLHTADGRTEIYLGDVIDNDSWRVWPGGDKAQRVDKDNYRELAEAAEDALADVKKKYAWVAEATTRFIE